MNRAIDRLRAFLLARGERHPYRSVAGRVRQASRETTLDGVTVRVDEETDAIEVRSSSGAPLLIYEGGEVKVYDRGFEALRLPEPVRKRA